MGKKVIEQIPIGNYLYDRRTKVIHNLVTLDQIEVAKYTVLKPNGRRYFSDGKLALEMFKAELKESTFDILEAEPRWVAAQ